MTKRSVALVGVLIVMAMIGSSVIGAVSAIAASDAAEGSFSVFLPLILNAIGAMAEVPQGAVMPFNLASCPSGWTEVTDAQGRAIVGLPSGGALSGEVGSGLSDLEDRTHAHEVNPTSFSTNASGAHSHSIDPPATASALNGTHNHSANPPPFDSDDDTHYHWWIMFIESEKWWRTWDVDGFPINITDWDNGMDSAGSGYFPISRTDSSASKTYYTTPETHNHGIDIPSFSTANSGSHDHTIDIPSFLSSSSVTHAHSVDVPNTSSTTASTSDVMPYIQFLVCEKD